MTSTALTQPSLASKDTLLPGKLRRREDEAVHREESLNGNGNQWEGEKIGGGEEEEEEDGKEEPVASLSKCAVLSTRIGSSPPIFNHRLFDDSSELSELDDSEAETEKLEPLDDSESVPPTISHKRRRPIESDDDDTTPKRRDAGEANREIEKSVDDEVDHEAQGKRSDSDRVNDKKDDEDDKEGHEEDKDGEEDDRENGENHKNDHDLDELDSKLPVVVDKDLNGRSTNGLIESESERELRESPQELAQAEQQREESRQKAIVLLTEIEVEFAKLRDQLHDDKMARFIAEIEMCADGTHPELSKVHGQITRIRDEKIQLAEKKRLYQLRSINNQINAMRDHLHQQFMKDEAECRVKLLLQTTEEWYKVNKERRAMDALSPEYSYRVADKRSTQIQDRIVINSEISLLSGISNYIGFPAAPAMSPANESELQEDLEALGIQY